MNLPASPIRPLNQRLDRLTLGLGAIAAAAASGAVLPPKAEAIPGPPVTGIHENSVSLSVTGDEKIRIRLSPYNSSAPIYLQTGNGPGWALQFAPIAFDAGDGNLPYYISGFGTGTHYQFQGAVYSASHTNNLADIATGWSNTLSDNASVGETYYIALRDSSQNRYGWAQVTTGSISHVQSAFNFDSNGAISLGQSVIPEPSRAVLLATGLAGLLVARRRRKVEA